MAKVADVKLTWKKSVSTDIAKVVLHVLNNGEATNIELPPETQEFMIVVKANGAFSFDLTVTDTEGRTATSTTFSATFGDLEDPQPPTELNYEIVAVRDEEPPPEPPPVERRTAASQRR